VTPLRVARGRGFIHGVKRERKLIQEQKNNIIMSEINIYRAIEDSKHFLDFLNKLIPRDEVEQIYNFYQKLRSRTFNGNYKLSYSEQCNLVLDKFADSVFFLNHHFYQNI
jgi:hypothetical protein